MTLFSIKHHFQTLPSICYTQRLNNKAQGNSDVATPYINFHKKLCELLLNIAPAYCLHSAVLSHLIACRHKAYSLINASTELCSGYTHSVWVNGNLLLKRRDVWPLRDFIGSWRCLLPKVVRGEFEEYRSELIYIKVADKGRYCSLKANWDFFWPSEMVMYKGSF